MRTVLCPPQREGAAVVQETLSPWQRHPKRLDLDVGKDPRGNIGPMEPWDLHYLRAIDDGGFIDNLMHPDRHLLL
jgi:hypothetical protein